MNSGKCGYVFVAEGKLNLALEHDACGEVFHSLGTSHCPCIPERACGVHPNPTPPPRALIPSRICLGEFPLNVVIEGEYL